MIKINAEKRLSYFAEEARKQRDYLLRECDGKMAEDSTCDKTTWTAYRQALRDVPGQKGFPENIIWPTEPI